MKKRSTAKTLTIALVGLGVLGYFSARQQSPDPGQAPPPDTVSGVEKVVPQNAKAPEASAPQTPAASLTLSADSPPALSPASIKQYRNDVKKNAHVTPPSVLRFAEQVSALMEKAKVNETAASAGFDELSKCVTEKDNTPPSMKALCLWNAQRLAKDFPKAIDSKYQALYKSAPDSVTDLLAVFALQ